MSAICNGRRLIEHSKILIAKHNVNVRRNRFKLLFKALHRSRNQCATIYVRFKFKHLHIRPKRTSARRIVCGTESLVVGARLIGSGFADTNLVLVSDDIHVKSFKLVHILLICNQNVGAVRCDQCLCIG